MTEVEEVTDAQSRFGSMSATRRARGYEVVADAIAEVCSGHVFGLIGDGNMAVLATLEEMGRTQYVAARHEASAVSMASGYARATGGLGVCTVTHGPGLTNALTALRAAVMDRSPLLLLLGELPVGQRHNLQYVDHAAFVTPTGAVFQQARDADELDFAVHHAAGHALSRRIPVVLQVTHESLFAITAAPTGRRDGDPGQSRSRLAPSAARSSSASPPRPDDVEAVAGLLAAADRPLLLVGRGVVSANAQEAVGALARRTGALVGTTLAAKNACLQAPHHIGVVGGFAHPDAVELIRGSDVVVALGASLNEFTTAHGSLVANARLIHVDESPHSLGRITKCDRYVLADVATFVAALLEELGSAPAPPVLSPERAASVAATSTWSFDDASDDEGVDPRTVVRILDQCFPPDRVAIIDGGHLIEWGSRHLQRGTVERWLPALGAGSIGLSPSLATGAALGTGAPTLAVVGDGSMMMALSAIDDAVRARAPVCFAVLNDGAYAAEVHKLRKLGLPDRLGWFGRPDLAAVATSLGARARRVATPSDLTELATGDWLPALPDGPLLLDVHVTPRVVSARLATP